jgi:glutathione S-transferase
MNPDGRVPTVVLDDGRPLAQSNAIIWRLAEGSDLIPEDAYARAKTLEWLFFEQYSHEPYIAVARFQVRYLGRKVADLEPRIVERGWAALGVLEQALAKSSFLQGEAPTLADIALVAYTRAGHEGGFHLSNHPAVKAWIGRVEQALSIRDPVGAPALA